MSLRVLQSALGGPHDREVVGVRGRSVVVAKSKSELSRRLRRELFAPVASDLVAAFDMSELECAIGLVLEARRLAELRWDSGRVRHHPVDMIDQVGADRLERVPR